MAEGPFKWRTDELAPWWITGVQEGSLSPEEAERRRLGAVRCERLYSSNPSWASHASGNPWFWHSFYDSRVNW